MLQEKKLKNQPYRLKLSHNSLAQSRKSELRKIINYLSELYRTGKISEIAFERLVEYVCQLFVEAEVKSRLSSHLEQKLVQRLGSYLEQKPIQ